MRSLFADQENGSDMFVRNILLLLQPNLAVHVRAIRPYAFPLSLTLATILCPRAPPSSLNFKLTQYYTSNFLTGVSIMKHYYVSTKDVLTTYIGLPTTEDK